MPTLHLLIPPLDRLSSSFQRRTDAIYVMRWQILLASSLEFCTRVGPFLFFFAGYKQDTKERSFCHVALRVTIHTHEWHGCWQSRGWTVPRNLGGGRVVLEMGGTNGWHFGHSAFCCSDLPLIFSSFGYRCPVVHDTPPHLQVLMVAFPSLITLIPFGLCAPSLGVSSSLCFLSLGLIQTVETAGCKRSSHAEMPGDMGQAGTITHHTFSWAAIIPLRFLLAIVYSLGQGHKHPFWCTQSKSSTYRAMFETARPPASTESEYSKKADRETQAVPSPSLCPRLRFWPRCTRTPAALRFSLCANRVLFFKKPRRWGPRRRGPPDDCQRGWRDERTCTRRRGALHGGVMRGMGTRWRYTRGI
ncbi:hypothetical protein EJ06DRAFT_224795 [Trichodelitschia bisporula]|uniref:Uncharacterized protein n=1 Tax=Trichodelitschia bisporula TaxID=703511 RepID=A0A6G1HKN4_9PEZI|nr:hypothetical protein EJ06DRAFT_224795 [Trichodelitschia bisporula]